MSIEDKAKNVAETAKRKAKDLAGRPAVQGPGSQLK